MLSQTLLQQTLQLARIELFILDLPQKTSFTSGIGVRNSRKVLIIKWVDAQGLAGYGECSCRPDPYYSEEYLDGAVMLVQKFIVPQLQKEITLAQVLHILRRIRGWNFTKAAVEAAAFQVARRLSGYSFTQDIATHAIEKVPVGISLGIYTDKGEAYEVVKGAIEDGYRRIKFKISPTVDTSVFEHINPLLFDNQVYTGFDANGSYFHEDLDKLGYFVETYQTIIEQPLPPSRYDVYQAAKDKYPSLRVCADEEVKSIGDLMKLKALGAIDELNLKLGRVGGVSHSVEILNYCQAEGIPCWIGGMFETGIGRVLNLELARFLPDARAHDLSPSSRYFIEDIVTPEVSMEGGFVQPDQFVNYEVLPEVMKRLEVAHYSYDF
ncbi:MAG TPA: o-succinylbenzoate synthase [Cytophagales bacterium]|nr:o-succinylbenzoate synthase [Cytophagales bacterium]HAA24175.1 o-succinylbenzoate synthase [Cytophagales bacterium]HAP60976.1 o-succinylbenzoate synthase [Cytophagales bacterium]